jgi:hypothetical protein
MIFHEKRRRQRAPIPNYDAEIEIEHTYGQNRKSVYKIVEYGEFGLSFLVPFEDGYFLVGTPVKFTIVQPSIRFRRMFTGVVRYYHPLFMEDGKKYYKIGLEIVTTYRDLQNKKLSLRAERIIPSEHSRRFVGITMDNEEYEFTLADFSKYSVAIFCDESDLIHFSISSTVKIETISIDDISIFSGMATVIRVYKDNQERNRVVFQPRNALINILTIDFQMAVKTAISEIKEAVLIHDQFTSLDTKFKTVVADLRTFLENIKCVLEEPKYQVPDNEAEQLLMQIFPDFFMVMDSQIMILDDIVRELFLSNEEHFAYKKYFQQNLLQLFLQSPFNHICYFKPNGYPGDYEMMKLNHLNAFSGPTLFAKILSKYSTSSHLGETARKRTEYLENLLFEYLKQNQNRPVNIFSIACGPALEIQELIAHHPEITNNVTITLLDQEIKALHYTMNNIYDRKIHYDSNITVNFIHDNLQNYLRDNSQNENIPQFDIIYSFGLFDYFDSSLGRFVINSIKPLVKPGGKIIVANASLDNNKYKLLMEFVFDWYLIYRDKDEMYELVRNNHPIDNVIVDEIVNGTMKFLTISL